MSAEWIDRFYTVAHEERRQRQMEDYKRDSLLLHEGRRVQAERMEAYAAHEHYEPKEAIDEH